MTDREMLVLAAMTGGGVFMPGLTAERLNGLYIERNPEIGDYIDGEWPAWGIQTISRAWNPLTDDGDALRLAVKLDLTVTIECQRCGAVSVEWGYDNSGNTAGDLMQEAPEGGDDYAATRRAIVRAAAAMAPKTEPA